MKLTLLFFAVIYPAIGWASTQSISVTKLSEDAFILNSIGYGTNIGLFKTIDGIVLVDPMPGEKNLDVLDTLIHNLAGGSARFILNTHAHNDHSGGNDYFIGKGALLINATVGFTEIADLAAKSHSAKDKVFFHKKSNSIWVGDIYDTSWHPTFYAGGESGFRSAIQSILLLGDARSIIVPGHGKPTGKAELRSFRNNTLDWIARVKLLKKTGMTAVEMKNDPPLKIIKGKFNSQNTADFLPEAAFVRFIERTLATIEKEGNQAAVTQQDNFEKQPR